MKIKENTLIRSHDVEILKELPNKGIKGISFDHTASIYTNCEFTEIHTQTMILHFEEFEVKFSNHYHESIYGTGLKYLILWKSPKSNRPYNFNFHHDEFMCEIKSAEIWGLNNEKQYWNNDKIELYKQRGLFDDSVSSIDHTISSQHILRLLLGNENCISILSDLPNVLLVKLESKPSSDNWLSTYYKWTNY